MKVIRMGCLSSGRTLSLSLLLDCIGCYVLLTERVFTIRIACFIYHLHRFKVLYAPNENCFIKLLCELLDSHECSIFNLRLKNEWFLFLEEEKNCAKQLHIVLLSHSHNICLKIINYILFQLKSFHVFWINEMQGSQKPFNCLAAQQQNVKRKTDEREEKQVE